MVDVINELLEDIFNIKEIKEYEFQNLYGFTFAFKRKVIIMNGKVASAEIRPVAIIYEENGEYYLAPLDVIEDINEIVKEYVKTI